MMHDGPSITYIPYASPVPQPCSTCGRCPTCGHYHAAPPMLYPWRTAPFVAGGITGNPPPDLTPYTVSQEQMQAWQK